MTLQDKTVIELLPCPFCGGEAEHHTIGDEEPSNAGGDVICCTRCQASSHVEFGRKENLVSRWNTRAKISAPVEDEGVVERVAPFVRESFRKHFIHWKNTDWNEITREIIAAMRSTPEGGE